MAAILDFRSKRFYLFFIYKTPRCFLPSFEAIGLLVQKKKRKIDFQDDRHSWISDRNDFIYFSSISHPNVSYQVSSHLAFRFRKSAKNRFSRWRLFLDFRSERFNLFLIYKSPECFLSSFESVGLSVQEKNRIIDFKMAAILDFRSERIYLFLIYKTPRCFLPSFESIDLSV